ncbi:MAG: hypothetical protein ACI9A7_001025 [Cyclobacteriaceae bacterium]|jgi:hypothetical protein
MKSIYFIIFLRLAVFVNAQDNSAIGFASRENYLKNISYTTTFYIEGRTKQVISNDYANEVNIGTDNRFIKKSDIRNKLWGVTINDVLYINSNNVVGHHVFTRAMAINDGLFYLEAPYPDQSKFLKELDLKPNYNDNITVPIMFGALGVVLYIGITNAASGSALIPLIYDIHSDQSFVLKKWGLNALMEQGSPEVYSSFLAEKAALKKKEIKGIDLFKYLKSTESMAREDVLKHLRTRNINKPNEINLHLFRRDKKYLEEYLLIVNDTNTVQFSALDYTHLTFSDSLEFVTLSSGYHLQERIRLEDYKVNYYYELQFDNQNKTPLKESDSVSYAFYKQRIDFLRSKPEK